MVWPALQVQGCDASSGTGCWAEEHEGEEIGSDKFQDWTLSSILSYLSDVILQLLFSAGNIRRKAFREGKTAEDE